MKVKIKKIHPEAIIPSYSTQGDAGMDMTAVTTQIDKSGLFIEYGTGIAVEIPKGYVGLLFPRSSLSKTSLVLANHVGVVDSGYRGEIKFRFKATPTFHQHHYEVGDKIGQLVIMPYPQIELEEVLVLNETVRGTGGFGSSGS